MSDVSKIEANGTSYDISDDVARAELQNKIYTISVGAFSSFPVTVNDSNITSDMVVLSATWSNPSAITSDVVYTTTTGVLQLTGTISGNTTATIVLGRSTF